MGSDRPPSLSQIRVEKASVSFHSSCQNSDAFALAGRSELCVIKTTPNTLWEMHSCQKRRPLPTCYFCVQFFNVCKIPVGSSLTILTLHQFGRISDQGHPHHQSVNVITRGKSLSILEWWVTIKFLSHHLSEILGETSKVCHL